MKFHSTLKSILFTFLLFFTANAFSDTAPIQDSAITAKVKAKIAMDKSLSVFQIGVSTNDGIVTLTGHVDSDSEASTAVEIAQSTDGVKDVDATQLTIASSKQPFSDISITAKIKGMFIKEKLFSNNDIAAMTISVETNNGVVYLTGTADSKKQAENAEKIAKSVAGVKSVNSHIEIKP